MCIRNIIFIKDKFYKPDKLDLGFIKDVEKIMEYFEILLSRSVSEQEKSDFNKKNYLIFIINFILQQDKTNNTINQRVITMIISKI